MLLMHLQPPSQGQAECFLQHLAEDAKQVSPSSRAGRWKSSPGSLCSRMDVRGLSLRVHADLSASRLPSVHG